MNVSTGSQVSTLAERFEPGDYQTRPFFDGKFLNTITHVPAGRALDALIRLLSELAEGQGLSIPDPWAYVNQSAARSPPGELTVDLAFFASSFGNRGSIANVREEDLRVGPLFRAAFESMARNYAACAHRLAPSRPWRRLVLSGGLAQNCPALRDAILARFEAGWRMAPAAEDTLLGLLALAMAFSGRAGSVQQAMTAVREASEKPGGVNT